MAKLQPIVAFCVSILFFCGPALAAGDVKRGRILVEMNCSTCHAVGRGGRSPYAPAPPFRTLHEKYDVSGLAEALAEGIVVGHTGARQMPRFVLEPDQIDDVIAYLKSLEAPSPFTAPQTPAVN